jgi:hypothetical protein
MIENIDNIKLKQNIVRDSANWRSVSFIYNILREMMNFNLKTNKNDINYNVNDDETKRSDY